MRKTTQLITIIMILLVINLPLAYAVSINPDSISVEVTETTASVSWETDEAIQSSLFYGKSTSNMEEIPDTAGETTAHSITLEDLDSDQKYFYNLEASSDDGVFTSPYYDFTTLLPTPQNLFAEDITHNYAEIEWDKVTGASKYNVYSDEILISSPSSNSFELENLSFSTTYTIKVTAVQESGEESAPSESLEIKTLDRPANITFLQSYDITESTAKVSWQTEWETNGTVYYGTKTNELNSSQSDLSKSTSHSFTLKALESDTLYYFKAVSASSESETYSFRTLSNDTSITISDIEVEDITMNSAEINWKTNVEADGEVYYGLDDSFEEKETHNEKEIYHTIELKGLLSGETYYYKIISNSQESQIYSFQTSENLEDFIDLDPISELTKETYLEIEGTTRDKSKMYFFINRFENPTAQVIIPELDGTRFNATLQLNSYITQDGVRGKNTIEINAWDEDGKKAIKTVDIVLDNLAPSLHVDPIPEYIRENDLTVSGYTDTDAYINILIGDQSKAKITADNETGYFNKTISVGSTTETHTISVQAIDEAGNINEHNQSLIVDRQDPKIEFYTSFTGTTHYKLFRIDGKTEPNAVIKITNFGEYSGCDDIQFIENFGECGRMADVYGPGPDYTFSATAALSNLLLGQAVVFGADEHGNFTAIIPLFSGQDIHTSQYSDISSSYSPSYYNMVGTNNIQFNVTDQAGNWALTRKTVNYEPGCPEWVVGKITSFPFNIYTEDMQAGEIDGSAVIQLNYLGAGSPENLQITAQEDTSAGRLTGEDGDVGTMLGEMNPLNAFSGIPNSNQYISIGSRIKYTKYEESSGSAYVYVPIKINRYTGDINLLPEEMGVYLDIKMSYADSYSGQSAHCDLYPVIAFDVQKPMSFAKWLSPTMINATIEILDSTINITQDTVDLLEKAALWTLVACGVKMVWDYASGLFGDVASDDPELAQCGGIDMKYTYYICDRVLCPPINPMCEGLEPVDDYMKDGQPVSREEYDAQLATNQQYEAEYRSGYNDFVDQPGNEQFTFNDYVTQHANYAQSQSQYGSYTSIQSPRSYQTTYNDKDVTVHVLDVNEPLAGGQGQTVGSYYAKELQGCPYTDPQSIIVYQGLDVAESPTFALGSFIQDQQVECSNLPPNEIDPTDATMPGCYKEGCPEYDETKCLLGKGAGHNPPEGLFMSVQCGCLPGAKAHLENLLQILEAAKKCFESALIGQETAGACERLFSYFVCDILTEVMKYIFDSMSGGSFLTRGGMGIDSSSYKDYSKSLTNNIKNRYGGIIAKAGLSTDMLVNKACIAAFTADWSELEGVLDKVIDQVEVAPIIAADAYSRPYGYDPFTGRISIGYNLYFGIVPGGETYISATLECDRSFPGGEYCAPGADSVPIDLVAKGLVRKHLSKDDFVNENVFYVDQNAASWYNKLVLEVQYQLGTENERQVKEYQIRKRGDLAMLNCQVSNVNGIMCEVAPEFQDITGTALGSVELFNNMQGSALSPTATFYPGNQVSAVVKVKNGYTSTFYIRANNNFNNLQYPALPGVEIGHYKDTQYYLLWLDDLTSSSSSSSGQLDKWSKDHANEGWVYLASNTGDITQPQGKFGVRLPDEFSSVTLGIQAYESDTNRLGKVTCAISKPDGLNYQNKYGVVVEGTFYSLGTQDQWQQVCSLSLMKDTEDCKKSWTSVNQQSYYRVYSYNSMDYYMCIMPVDKFSGGNSGTSVKQISDIDFESSSKKPTSTTSTHQFNLVYASSYVNNNPQTFISTYSSTSSSSVSSSYGSARINVLSDINGDGCGESKIYSADAQNPQDQEFKFDYSYSRTIPSGNLKPIVHFIEPTTIIEQTTGFINNDHKAVPLGFTIWDDKNSIGAITIGILTKDQEACSYTWTSSDGFASAQALSAQVVGECVMQPTQRFIGFQPQKPAFFEFDLMVDGIIDPNDPDKHYDVTITAIDYENQPSQPITRTLRFDQVEDPDQMFVYNDMLVCLGGSACAGLYEPPNTNCAEQELSQEEQLQLQSQYPTQEMGTFDIPAPEVTATVPTSGTVTTPPVTTPPTSMTISQVQVGYQLTSSSGTFTVTRIDTSDGMIRLYAEVSGTEFLITAATDPNTTLSSLGVTSVSTTTPTPAPTPTSGTTTTTVTDKSKKVLAIGTSTTAATQGYYYYLNELLGSQGYTFDNRGYGSCQTDDVRDCLKSGGCSQDCAGNSKPLFNIDDYGTIIILSGLNDGLCSGDPDTSTIPYLEDMYEYAKGKGMTVIAMPITPAKRWFDEKCSSGGGGDHSVSYTNELNNWILSKPVNVDYVIDIYSLLNDGSGYLDASKGYDGPPFNDGLHPSYVAHEAIANKLYDEIFSTWTTTPTPTPTSTPVVTTPAPAATSGSCIIFYGDTQTRGEPHTTVVDAIEDEGCSYYYLFHVGDLVSSGSSSNRWDTFLNVEKDLIDKGKFYPVVGNHELYDHTLTSHYGVTEILNGIGSSFTYLDSMFSQNDYKGWYTEQITDNIAFIGLNNGLIFKYPSTFYDDECKEQNTFLTNALDANKGKKIIIAYHAPAFPRLTRYSSDSCAKNEWHEIIKNYASYSDIVVISGHTHGLAHGEKDGITYLEVGASNSGLAPDCRSTSSAGVDSSQGCKNTNGYYRCDSSLTTCSAKDTSRNTLYTVTI